MFVYLHEIPVISVESFPFEEISEKFFECILSEAVDGKKFLVIKEWEQRIFGISGHPKNLSL